MLYLKDRLHDVKRFNPDGTPPIIDPEPGLSGDWADFMAGYITAEGSFGVFPNKTGFAPTLHVRVRQDDHLLLQQFRSRTECGRLYYERRPTAGRSPAVSWIVKRRSELARLVSFLDEHPPLGRKWREFSVWRKAALLYASDVPRNEVRAGLADLRAQLSAVRTYVGPDIDPA